MICSEEDPDSANRGLHIVLIDPKSGKVEEA